MGERERVRERERRNKTKKVGCKLGGIYVKTTERMRMGERETRVEDSEKFQKCQNLFFKEQFFGKGERERMKSVREKGYCS